MDYIINYIKNFNVLCAAGFIQSILPLCNSIVITNIRKDEYSIVMQKNIEKYFREKYFEVDIDMEYYEFEKGKNLIELGDGDKSSLFFALQTGRIIIENNAIVVRIAEELGLETISIESFIKQFINDDVLINMFNEMKFV